MEYFCMHFNSVRTEQEPNRVNQTNNIAKSSTWLTPPFARSPGNTVGRNNVRSCDTSPKNLTEGCQTWMLGSGCDFIWYPEDPNGPDGPSHSALLRADRFNF